ncbi:MAG: GNAT family N-acetyltransferase, partial [Proteobacteria bacterium]|nr:GNAT family N-acetyltransferase [Pseudomonadota bacterium]
ETYKKYFINARQTVREAIVVRPGAVQALGDLTASALSRVGGKGEALRTSLRRRWSTIEACEPTAVGQVRGAAVAARALARKATAAKKTTARVAHA